MCRDSNYSSGIVLLFRKGAIELITNKAINLQRLKPFPPIKHDDERETYSIENIDMASESWGRKDSSPFGFREIDQIIFS